jgi:ADP-ribose pyrophosphatase YjhB (NUDIX family)
MGWQVAGLVALAVVSARGAATIARIVIRWGRGGGKWSSAGGVVTDGRGRIALVRQRDRKGRWRWTLPKGRIDRGETPEAAALREVYEESGLRARIVRPIVLHEGRWHFTHFFEMALERDDGIHDAETREVRRVSFVEAVDLLSARRDLLVLRRLIQMHTGVVATPPGDRPPER